VRAGDEAALFRRQKHHQVGDVAGFSVTTERNRLPSIAASAASASFDTLIAMTLSNIAMLLLERRNFALDAALLKNTSIRPKRSKRDLVAESGLIDVHDCHRWLLAIARVPGHKRQG
jgi:hypothetical protein